MADNSVRHGFLCNNSGLSILLHGVFSLHDATPCDKCSYGYKNDKYRLILCSTQLRMKLLILINVKMSTIVGNLTYGLRHDNTCLV